MRKRHYVIIQNEEEKPQQILLKDWFRVNRESHEVDTSQISDEATSHEMRRALTKIGWSLHVLTNEVLVIKPDSKGAFDYAEEYVDGMLEDESEVNEDIETIKEFSFSLERDLQTSLRQNISSLEEGLKIIDGGGEKSIDGGRIDILAKDRNGKQVIIELKAGEAKNDVIAQVLHYMQAIQDDEKTDVRGIIIASAFPNRVEQAAKQIPNLTLFKYGISFLFNEV